MDEQNIASQATNVSQGGLSEFAIVSLVLGIFSFVTILGLEKPIIAIVFGILALRRIAVSPQYKGKNLAIVGIALGAIAIVLIITLVVINYPRIIQMQQSVQRQSAAVK